MTSPAQVEPLGYYRYGAGTARLGTTDDNELVGEKLDLTSGEFVTITPAEILDVLDQAQRLNENGFIAATEEARRINLSGEGTIFALYELIDSIHAHAGNTGRAFTAEEEAVIILLRRQTFQLWEDELDNRAEGAPPSFPCGPK